MAGASHALVPESVASGDATSKPVAEKWCRMRDLNPRPSVFLGRVGFRPSVLQGHEKKISFHGS